MNATDKLRHAASLIAEVEPLLNQRGIRCGCCQLVVRENMMHFAIGPMLRGMRDKLRRFADQLDQAGGLAEAPVPTQAGADALHG